MSSSLDMQRGLPYRRRLFVARHRKRSVWVRLLRPFAIAVLLVGSPAALAAWVMTSPEFTLREIAVEGAEKVSAGWVESELEALSGRPLLELPAEPIERLLEAHPWVRRAQVRKRLPDRLEVSLDERRPVAVTSRGGELWFLDADGVAFAPFEPGPSSSDLLLVSGSDRPADVRAAMSLATRLVALDAELGSGLSEVEVLNRRDFRLYGVALPFPLVVSMDDLGRRIESLRDVLPVLEGRLEAVGAIDLRFERTIVVQPVKDKER